MNIYKKLAITTTGIALSLIAIESNPVKAATITYDFTVDIVESEFLNNFSVAGFFSYDDSSIEGTGSEIIPVTSATYIRTFESNPNSPSVITSDTLYGGGAPVFRNQANVLIENGMFNGLQWTYGQRRFEFDIDGQDYDEFIFFSFPFPCSDTTDLFCRTTGNVEYTLREDASTSVPESSSIVGVSLLGLGFIFKRKLIV